MSGDSEGCNLLATLARMFNCPIAQPRVVTVTLAMGPVRGRDGGPPSPEGVRHMAESRLMQRQEFDAVITNIVDSQGRPTSFDGAPTWESSDPNIVDVRPDEDGMSAVIGSLDTDGSAVITVTGDARQGDEVVTVLAKHTVHVAPGDVAMFEVSAGEARDRTDATSTDEEPATT